MSYEYLVGKGANGHYYCMYIHCMAWLPATECVNPDNKLNDDPLPPTFTALLIHFISTGS
jgi:hypothetical protein